MPNALREWVQIATTPAVFRRGLKYAVIVGFILIAINHGDAILRQQINSARIAKMVLTVFVPYMVSTASSVSAIRHHQQGKT